MRELVGTSTERLLAARARIRAAEEVARSIVRIPPPTLTAEQVDPAAPWVPAGPRNLYRRAVKAGWRARMTRAVGPRIDASGAVPKGQEQVPTLAVAVQAPDGRRYVAVWRYRTDVKTVGWSIDGVADGRTGEILSIAEVNGAIE